SLFTENARRTYQQVQVAETSVAQRVAQTQSAAQCRLHRDGDFCTRATVVGDHQSCETPEADPGRAVAPRHHESSGVGGSAAEVRPVARVGYEEAAFIVERTLRGVGEALLSRNSGHLRQDAGNARRTVR